jgi:glycosyltransferase involved in cell wall biosynthesis
MRVGINGRALAKPEPTGVSRYSKHLLTALADRDDGIEYVVFGVESPPPSLRTCPHVETAGTPPSVSSGLRGHVWEQGILPRIVGRHDIDVLHSPAGFTPLLTDVPTVLTVHDISPVTHSEWFSRGYATLYRVVTPLALRQVDHVITISEFSKAEVVNEYPQTEHKISTVYNGINPISEANEDPVDGARENRYLLFLGAIDPRKNVARILDAYRNYRSRVSEPLTLIFAGAKRDISSAVDRPSTDGVRTLGYVSNPQRNWLYKHAKAFIFPSLYEGFGLPILEAMSIGTPVLTSNCGAMAEIAGDAALLVDPRDTDSIADGMERVATDRSLRNELSEAGKRRAAQFNWRSTAEKTAAVFRAVANRASSRDPDASVDM